jgi:hypothetical protein
MATKPKTTAPATDGDTAVAEPPSARRKKEAPAAQAGPHPSIFEYQDVWVFHEGVALVDGLTGFLTVLKTDAATMIAAGDAVDPYWSELPPIGGAAAVPVPVVVAITAFSAANPTIATASAGDTAKLANGDVLRLTQTAGAALPPIAGMTGTVSGLTATTFALTGIDLSAFSAVIDGVTATGTKQ